MLAVSQTPQKGRAPMNYNSNLLGHSGASSSTSSLRHAGFQIASAPSPARAGYEETVAIHEVLHLARQALTDPDPLQRAAGIEMVMLGGKAIVLEHPRIMSELAILLHDQDREVASMAYNALDILEIELSRPDSQPPSRVGIVTESRSLVRRPQSTNLVLACQKPDYSLLDRLGSFNRRIPRPEAMQALSSIVHASTCGSRPGSSSSNPQVPELQKPGIAHEILPHLTDAVRACREAPIRRAAVDALMELGTYEHEAAGSVDLEIQDKAMDGLSAALRARTNKLLQELNVLAPAFYA